MTYPTVAELKTWLGIAGSSEDTQVTIIINGAIATCEQLTNRVWVAATATKVFPVEYPYVDKTYKTLTFFEDLCTITTVTNGDGVVVAATEYDAMPLLAPYYQLKLRRESGKSFTRSSAGAGVSIAGTWGATTACPNDLKELILELATHRYRMRQNTNAGQVVTTSKSGIIAQPADVPQYIKDAFEDRKRSVV